MDPRQEAFERLGGRYDVRVLEPSPPALTRPPFIDDPVNRGAQGQLPVVSPVPTGDLLWSDLVQEDPLLGAFCADRWLAAFRTLDAPPADYARTRDALHLVAQHVISPTRQRANGEVTLRYTRGGFGTSFFGDDVQLRVEGDVFVVQQADRETRGTLTSLKDAAEYVGYDLTRYDVAIADEPLGIDADAGRWLGDLFGFAFSVLEELRARAPGETQPSFVSLWPETFRVALELGVEAAGTRAAYGVSPGDATEPHPYLYVTAWAEPEADRARLPLSDLLVAPDQREAALAFLVRHMRELTGSDPEP